MSVDSNYYIPELEDLFIGYECEAIGQGGGVDSLIIDKDSIIRIYLGMWTIKTKYLDEEDIIATGFKRWSDNEYRKESQYGMFILDKSYPEKLINISFVDHLGSELTVFFGICPSINELRKIEKLIII